MEGDPVPSFVQRRKKCIQITEEKAGQGAQVSSPSNATVLLSILVP